MAIAKRKKKFFEAEIQQLNKNIYLMAYEPEELDGRIVKHDLTRFLKGKSVMFQGRVKADKDKAVVIPEKLQIMPYFLRRVIRKGVNCVEDSFIAECKDARLRIKPFLITRRKVSRSIRKALRNKAREELTSYAKDKNPEEIFDDFLNGKLQKTLGLKLKKVYPLSFCDIRVLEVKKGK